MEQKCIVDNRDGENTFLGFEINTIPSGKHDQIIVPEYDCKRRYKLAGDCVKDLDETQTKKKRSGPSCWNCGQLGHSNKECPLPKNHQAFLRNRQQFMNNRSARNGVVRYHTDNEQRYDHLKPGLLSRRLRRALGLQENQLPRHIYRMRLLGYPPGWLEEAKVVHSGISLFDSKGHVVADPDDEEGEVVDSLEQRNKYDFNKLVKYPGFNVPPPAGTIDEAERLRMPPMSENDSIENLVESLRPNEAKSYRRRKVPVIPSASPPRVKPPDHETQPARENFVDMECEETPDIGLLPEDNCGFVPPLPEDSQELPPPPPPPLPPPPPPPPQEMPEPFSEPPSAEDGECSSQSNEAFFKRDSPTLVELEEQKKSILVELNDESGTCDSLSAGQKMVSPTINRLKDRTVSPVQMPSSSLGRMKSVDLGTPVLKSVSPYSKLPSPESFSRNICDVINFENLPNSTGIYDKMVSIINKVRSAVKRQHDCN